MQTYSKDELTPLELERYEGCVQDFGEKGYLYIVTENCPGAGYEIMYSSICLDNMENIFYDPDRMRYITDIDAMLERF